MRKHIVLVLIVILALAVSGCAPFSPAPPTKAILKGRVLVPQRAVRQVGGQALAGATVNVIDPVTGNIVAITTTDANGYYRVEVPPGGPYIIEVVKGSIKVLDVSPQVEVGETYDLGTADATSTAVALVFQAKVEAGEDPAEIDLDEILEDPRIGNLIEAIEEALAAGKDPTTAPEVIHLVDVIVTPPKPSPSPAPKPEPEPTPTYTVTFKVTPADTTVVVKDSKGNVVTTTTPGVYKLAPGAYTYTVSKTGYVTQTGEFTVVNKDLTIEVNLNLAPDTTPPTLVKLTAYVGEDKRVANAANNWTLNWTVGETVTKIEAIASEPVKLVEEVDAVVRMSGGGIDAVYGTITVDETDSTKLIITPNSGNETAGLAGTFTFTVAEGVVEDAAGNKNKVISVILKVAPPEGRPIYNETKRTYHTTIEEAINEADEGNSILLTAGNYTITDTIDINKAITIKGAANFSSIIQTSGGNPVFKLSAAATLDGIFIRKTDKVNQHLIEITVDNVVIKNCKFIGQYNQGDNEVVRAILTYAGVTGYTLSGNYFENVRQPAYLEGTGKVENNFVKNTRGWVVCVNYEVIFSGNTFEDNAVDIAIIENNQTQSNFYKDIAKISRLNNGAHVENQLLKASAKNGNLVVEAGGNQYINSIENAINAAVYGDTICINSGNYNGFAVNKDNITIKGIGEVTITPVNIAGYDPNTGIAITASGIVVEGLIINGGGITPSRGVSGSSGAKYTVKNVTFKNLTTGIYANASGSGTVELTAIGNEFNSCTAGIGGTENTLLYKIEGNTFSGCTEGIGLGPGVHSRLVGDDYIINYLVDNNTFTGCTNTVKDYRPQS